MGWLIIIGAAWMIDRLWPSGALFVTIYPAAGLAIGVVIKLGQHNDYGEPYSFTTENILMSYMVNMLATVVIFMVAFGIKKFIRRRKISLSNKLPGGND